MAVVNVLIRTEMELASDVVVQLLRVGLVGNRHETIMRASEAAGVPMSELQLAFRRAESRGYRPPRMSRTADAKHSGRDRIARCRCCGEVIVRGSNLGRPPLYCEDCRGSRCTGRTK